MGIYIDPVNQTKEDWLKENAEEITVTWDNIPDKHLIVVLVNNGPFTAAAICYSKREYAEFTRNDDYRPKRYFIAPISKLKIVAPELEKK